MKAAGLKAIDTVLSSTAVLVKSRNTNNRLVELIASRIRGVISESYPNTGITPLPPAANYLLRLKLPRSIFCVNTTSLERNFNKHTKSLQGNGHQPSHRWMFLAGWLLARWWRRK